MPEALAAQDPIARLESLLSGFDDPRAAIRRLPDDLRTVAERVLDGSLTPAAVDADVARALGRASAILARRMAGPPEGDLA